MSLHWRIALAVLCLAKPPAPAWVEVLPKDGGCAIQMPAMPKEDPKNPGRFSVENDSSSWILRYEPLDPPIRDLVASGNRRGVDRVLVTLRDGTVKGMSAQVISSATEDFQGFSSILFRFEGTLEGKPFGGTQRIVLTRDRMYLVVVMAVKGAVEARDVEKYFASFRLTAGSPPVAASSTIPADAAAPGSFRTIPYVDVVCGKMPSVPVTFSLPADYVSRSVGNVEAGCLWGTREDLDRVTASPQEGDFSALRRGVFRARVSTNVVCTKLGTFDSMDGSGEAGIRTQFQASGASLVNWKKTSLGGLPALEIVADVGAAGRVYMLYLGNTRFSSNAILVNYYQAKKRTAADDETWSRFVAGIRKAS